MGITWSPSSPVAGDEVTVSVTVSGVDSNLVDCDSAELTIVSVPSGSTVATGLLLDDAGEPKLSFTADVAGQYEISAQKFTEYTGSDGFDGGSEPHAIALSTETGTIYVGATLMLPIVTDAGSLTLTITTGEDDVKSATLGDATTQRAEWAALDATVTTKLAALVGQTVTSLGPALPAKVGDLGLKVDAHFRNATAHPTGGGYTSDSINSYGESVPVSIAEAVNKLNKIRTAYVRHALNSTTSTIHWHNDQDDTKNVPIVGPATTVGEAVVLYADLAWRCYEAHRQQTASPQVHSAADVTNTLGSIDKLSDLIAAICTFLADETPTLPVGVNEASVEAVSLYGFQA